MNVMGIRHGHTDEQLLRFQQEFWRKIIYKLQLGGDSNGESDDAANGSDVRITEDDEEKKRENRSETDDEEMHGVNEREDDEEEREAESISEQMMRRKAVAFERLADISEEMVMLKRREVESMYGIRPAVSERGSEAPQMASSRARGVPTTPPLRRTSLNRNQTSDP